jgi:hypothetical protein
MPSTCSKTAASILGCTEKQLRDFANHPQNLELLLSELKGKKVRTTYKDRNGFHKTFWINGITEEGADKIMAFGKLPRPFNVCIPAFYYCRHSIRLMYPFSPCIVEKFKAGEDHFYPLELIELVSEVKPTAYRAKLPSATKMNELDLAYDPLHGVAFCKGKFCPGQWLPVEEIPSPPGKPSALDDTEFDHSMCNKEPKIKKENYWWSLEEGKTPSPPDTPSTLANDEFDFDRATCSQAAVSPTYPLVTRAPAEE